MIRIFLFTAIFSLCAAAVILPVPSARAEGGKGLSGFFNRSKANDVSNQSGAPVHMSPGVQGSAGPGNDRPVNLGRAKEKAARYEDSPMHKEREQAKNAFREWNENELAERNVQANQVVAQILADTAAAEQRARKQQAEKIAQGAKRISSGMTPPGVPDQAVLEAMRKNNQQSLSTISGGSSLPPEPVAQTAEPNEEPAAAKPKREFKPRHFFNRTE